MSVDWPSFWIGVVAVPVAAAVVALVVLAASRALSTNLGRGGCHVCDRGFTCEIGEYTRLGIWLRSRRHQWFIRNQRWHRAAWARHRWNPYRLPGYPEDNSMAAIRRPRPSLLVRIWWLLVS